jgi:hypothetical protein
MVKPQKSRTTLAAEKAAILALVDSGRGARTEIATTLGLSYSRVDKVLKRAGRIALDERAAVQSARMRALNLAQGEATRAKILVLDDQGRDRAEVAAELGLTPRYVAQVLAAAGRGVSEAERITRSRTTRNAQSAELRAEILELDDLGRSRQEIATQLGRSYDHVCVGPGPCRS